MLAGRASFRASVAAAPIRARAAARSPANMTFSLFGFAMPGSRTKPTELAPKDPPPGKKLATFAGGCFWGLELAFQRTPGVYATSVGYTAGHKPGPTYNEVCSGSTGHAEAVQCTYAENEVSYDQLLDVFFSRTDPTTPNRQGNDRGTQYRSAIYFHDEAQKAAAANKIKEMEDKIAAGDPVARRWEGRKVVVQLEPAGDYYLAEDYHQQYLEKGGQSAAKNATERIRCYG